MVGSDEDRMGDQLEKRVVESDENIFGEDMLSLCLKP